MERDKMTTKMKKSLKYGFTTCTLAYLLASVPVFVLFATLFRGLSEPIVDIRGMLHFLILGLSDFSLWDNFYYLAPIVPWIASSCVLALSIYRFDGGSGRRLIFSGLSIFIYYFAMWLAFMIHGLIFQWGDVAYDIIWLWPVFGFCTGIAASAIVEKVFGPQDVEG